VGSGFCERGTADIFTGRGTTPSSSSESFAPFTLFAVARGDTMGDFDDPRGCRGDFDAPRGIAARTRDGV